MSAAVGTDGSPRGVLDKAAIGLVVVLGAGILWYFSSQQQYELRDSPTGFDGLKIWLASEGHSAETFVGGWPLDSQSIGLLVQPVFDAKLDKSRSRPANQEELLQQTDEYDQRISVIREKSAAVKSLVILPKWRTALRLAHVAHPELRVPQSLVQETLAKIAGAKAGQIHYGLKTCSTFKYKSDDGILPAAIYEAQLFDGYGCDPIIGEPGAMLLGLCPLSEGKGKKVYVLSDPDLLNNHGLRLADNAKIAAMLLPSLAGEKRIVIDYSPASWLTKPRGDKKRERSWSDLARLFAFPFTILWAGAAALLALAIWRGGLRTGPVIREARSNGPGNRSANEVRARLMRMTDQDGALLSDYIDARLQVQAVAALGPVVAGEGAEKAYLRYVRRRAPALAKELEQILERIRALPAHLDANEAIDYAGQFESTLEQIVHDT